MRGSTCASAKLVSGAFCAIRPASSSALSRASPGRHQALRQADALAVPHVVDLPGQHPVGHARRADRLRYPHRAAAATAEDAARAFGQRIERRFIGHPDVAGAGQFEPVADHRAVQRGNDRHRARTAHGRVPHATCRMPHATCHMCVNGACPGPRRARKARSGRGPRKRDSFTGDDGRTDLCGQLFEDVAQRQKECVVQRIALGGARQAHQRDLATQFELDVLCASRGCLLLDFS